MPKSIGLILCLLFFSACAKKMLPPSQDVFYENQERIESKPDKDKAAKLNIELGLTYLKEGQVSRAKAKLNRALVLAPHLSEVHYTLGYFFEQIGEVATAKQSYLKAIAIHPTGGIEHNNYGAFLCRQKHYHEAEKEFLKAVADWQYTDTAQAFENAGMCLLQIPDKEKARLYFEKALRHDPKSPNALLELAQISLERREFKQAKQYLLQYQSIFPANSQSLLLEKKLYLH